MRLGVLSALGLVFVSGAVAEEKQSSQLIELIEKMPPSEMLPDAAPYLETYRMECTGLPNLILYPETDPFEAPQPVENPEAVKMIVSKFEEVRRIQFLQVVAFKKESSPIMRTFESESGSPLVSAVWYVRAKDVACSLKGPGQL